MNDTRGGDPIATKEVLLRLDAIAAWVEHAKRGECPVEVAHTAIGELQRACNDFLRAA